MGANRKRSGWIQRSYAASANSLADSVVDIVTPGEKAPALSGNRVLFEQGVPVAVQSVAKCAS